MNSIILKSPAKVNFGLRVVGKRLDGYHDIETVMHTVSLFDIIKIELQDKQGILLTTSGRKVPTGRNNIAFMAADLLLKKYTIKSGISITIEKKIPVAAGLGGGSSNAAFVLLGLNKLLGLRLSKNELIKLGAELGSDVPFFIFGNCSFVTGRGEVLQKLCLKRGAFLILVNPGIAISTKSVYDSVNIKLTKKRNHISMTPPLFDLYENLHVLSNDLETVVRRQYSQISDIKDQLMKLGALAVQLSGSGSTVYGVFPTWIDAKTALSQLETVTSYDSFLVYTL